MKLYYLCVTFLMPAIMILTGVAWRKKGPAKVNSIFGYRTKLSMINQETWQFAHQCVGRIWLKFGLILCGVTVIAFLFFMNGDVNQQGITAVVIIILQLALLFLSIPMTERQLKSNFDEYGRRKK